MRGHCWSVALRRDGKSGCTRGDLAGRTVDVVTEQQPYEVLEQRDAFEVRLYPPHLLAQVERSMGPSKMPATAPFAPCSATSPETTSLSAL